MRYKVNGFIRLSHKKFTKLVLNVSLMVEFCRMKYPVELVEVAEGVTLHIPRMDEVRSIYEKGLAEGLSLDFPYWAKIWPSASALTNFLQNNLQYIEGKRVLELGAGIGLPSFSIAEMAAEVIVSDHNQDAVDLMHINILHVGNGKLHAMCVDWNQFPQGLHADTILLSDINYEPSQFNALYDLIQALLKSGSTLIISTPQRIMAVPFAARLSPFVKTSTTYSIEENGQHIDVSVMVLCESV